MTRARSHGDLLLAVWRAACRDLDLTTSLPQIAATLASLLPPCGIVVRHLDLARRRLETVGVAGDSGAIPAGTVRRSDLDPDDIPRLLGWFRSGQVLRDAGDDAATMRAVLPRGLVGQVIAGPLEEPGGASGVVLLVARNDRFSAAHVEALQTLLEPLAVALGNDARMRELARLRESLEADKRALLSRLDRQDVADAVVGSEAGLREVMARVEQVAATDTPVLLIGETGSGKEVVARLVHTRSRRARAPVVRVNCGAIPAGLVDSELFGHERGSFTGAVASRQGWFERADGGTLFLDEVGELPLEAQVRLLRILQDGTFERVGGQKVLTVDVRIVAATHRDLHEMVGRGTFREDLWYRLGVFPIWLPPLRDRPEDIPSLATHFARRAGARLGGTPLTPTPADLELLLRYDWPGNVRELAAVIERAAILGDGHSLRIDAALGLGGRPTRQGNGIARRREGLAGSAEVDSRPASPVVPEPTPADPADTPWAAPPARRWSAQEASLDQAMRAHIEAILTVTHGRIEGPLGAAVRLHVNPHTLRSRMRRLGIDWRRFRGRPRA